MPGWIFLIPSLIKLIMEIIAMFAKKPAQAVSQAREDLRAAMHTSSPGNRAGLKTRLEAIRDRLREVG